VAGNEVKRSGCAPTKIAEATSGGEAGPLSGPESLPRSAGRLRPRSEGAAPTPALTWASRITLISLGEKCRLGSILRPPIHRERAWTSPRRFLAHVVGGRRISLYRWPRRQDTGPHTRTSWETACTRRFMVSGPEVIPSERPAARQAGTSCVPGLAPPGWPLWNTLRHFSL
jgi:hypothetical protein